MKISLTPSFFGETEKVLFEHGKMSLSLFRYSTGICGMTLKNARGYMTVLPFKGFQVWRAGFDGHELVMKTLFDEPTESTEYCKTYGAFLIHCGLTAIGNPDVGAGDTHPLHAELPNIGYDKAWAVCGDDEKGKYVELCGSCRYVFGFETGYEFRPTYRLYENATTFTVHNEIENLRGCRQEYSYMCHMNFRPVDGSRLVYSAKTENIYVHELVPDTLTKDEQQKLKDYFGILKKDIHAHDLIGGEGQFYQPEVVFTVKYETDEEGRGHCMQVFPDGYAGYVSHHPAQLPFGIRWISRFPNEDAVGMLLPATGEHNGHADCVKKGYIRYMEADETVSIDFETGLLTPDEVTAMKEKIARMTV